MNKLYIILIAIPIVIFLIWVVTRILDKIDEASWIKAAEQGDVKAQFKIAGRYHQDKKYDKAFGWFFKAAT